ncbi:hypothetical protein LSH36_155g02029 [Paralvinella palmiformis]|uniref:ABC-type glutathione-S-conjugate transporter n=1 Tax=Paralvinella palmiformis TaxID=53620 RepID=A0AAD9JV58_9ANNE|nr:hypothetical protein LSH36_155g02029 [Paralvinella palmiformis]
MADSNSSSFTKFCGGEFWNLNLTWYTQHPDFTLCFQRTVVAWVAPAFLWLLLPIYAVCLCNMTGTSIPCNKMNSSKTIISALLALLSLADLVKSLKNQYFDEEDQPLVMFVTPAILMATYLTVIILIQVERIKGFITSGVLFLFWILSLIAGIIPFYSNILQHRESEDFYRFTLFYLSYALIIVQTVLASIAESLPYEPLYGDRKKICPEVEASFLSRVTFWWLNSLCWLGYRKTLEETDIWDLNPRDLTKNNYPRLAKAWRKELDRCGWYNEQKIKKKQLIDAFVTNGPQTSSLSAHHDMQEETPLLGSGKHTKGGSTFTGEPKVEFQEKKKKTKKPSLFWVIAKVFGFTLLQAHLCKLVCDVLTFVGPTLQRYLIQFTENKEAEMWKGYMFAALFFVSAALYSFFFHQLYYIGMVLGMRIKASIIAAVYEKALTMSNEARKTSTVGEIVNLMSVDAQRMQDVTGFLWMIWSSPLQIIVALWLLWGIMGPSVLAGLTIMLLLLPLNGYLASIQRKMQIRFMAKKDERLKMMNEVLNGMKVTLATFVTYVLLGNDLDATKAFTSLSLFNILRFPINMLPMMVTYIVTASVSIKRLGRFLRNGDLDENSVQHNPRADHPIVIQNGTFAWGIGKDDLPILKNISVTIPDGKLVAVVGQVGAGKSSLINAVLGEMEKLSGYVNVRGSVAYVAQQAWIQNNTVKDNILFGHEMETDKYNQILDACALRPDLDILPAGDMTEIGEKGINLSGGQKQRVSLARAVYFDSDIYLMDDPLSAVDSHTRVLVTHGLQWLPKVDQIIVLVNGKVSEVGSYEQLLDHNGAFAQFLKTYFTELESDSEVEDEEIEKLKSTILHRIESVASSDKDLENLGTRSVSGSSARGSRKARRRSRRHTVTTEKSTEITDHPSKKGSKAGAGTTLDKKAGEKLIEEEKSASGRVKLSVFGMYIKALGIWNTVMFVMFFVMFQAASVGSNIWLSKWTDDPTINNGSLVNTSYYNNLRNKYLGVYGGLGALQAVCVLFYAIIAASSMVKAAGILHFKMLSNILQSPMSFFDTTPLGRILNRFTRDIETVDNIMPGLIRSFLNTFFGVITTVLVISYSTPIFLSVIVPLGLLYYFIQRFYIPTTRQLKRIESTTRSPIYANFSETISGASTIRAFGVQGRWLGFRLEFLGAFVVVAAALFAVLGRNTLAGGIVGLSISYALQVTSSLNWMVRMTTDIETNIVSVERIKEYTETPTEAEWYIDHTKPPPDWPNRGQIRMIDYAVRYRAELSLVLKGLNITVKAGEKVGIVGRTGAGKSSLTLGLFRIIEATRGSIMIDGKDISTLGLHQLRSKLTILPQDPVLFSGDLRMNLDPFDRYADDELWIALEHAHLRDFVATLPAGLNYEVGEGGQNLSVGQRQLVCLARTLLHKTHILILDEATAAVDLETDELIQNTIQKEFADCTILTIAHRLNTIMDNDRVIVLSDGLVKEFDTPSKLLDNKESVFYSMAKDAGLVS